MGILTWNHAFMVLGELIKFSLKPPLLRIAWLSVTILFVTNEWSLQADTVKPCYWCWMYKSSLETLSSTFACVWVKFCYWLFIFLHFTVKVLCISFLHPAVVIIIVSQLINFIWRQMCFTWSCYCVPGFRGSSVEIW